MDECLVVGHGLGGGQARACNAPVEYGVQVCPKAPPLKPVYFSFHAFKGSPMPIIQIQISAPHSAVLTQRIASGVSELTVQWLHKKAALISTVITCVHPQDWVVGGQTLAAQGLHSFYLGIKITDETNTKAEKAQFIAAVFDFFKSVLGALHSESYVHVEDVRATAYGYGGRTQEWRYHAGAISLDTPVGSNPCGPHGVDAPSPAV
jgi:4-oxalocrotonate tautomerase